MEGEMCVYMCARAQADCENANDGFVCDALGANAIETTGGSLDKAASRQVPVSCIPC